MTDAMLRLAKQVYGERAYCGPAENGNVWIRGEYNFPSPPRNSELFDPINNAEQAWDVLAWLLSRNCVIGKYAVIGPSERDDFDHDGTDSGIREAVVQAAMRVAGDK